MALQANYTDGETSYEAAYVRITRYSGDKSDASILASLYESEEARNNGDESLLDLSFSLEYDTDSADGVLQQGYTFLKTADGFSEVTDLL